MTEHLIDLDTTPRVAVGRPVLRWPRILTLTAGLVLLVALRLAFVHGDPSDFPEDRNIAASIQVRLLAQELPPSELRLNLATIKTLLRPHQRVAEGAGSLREPNNLTPEFPFVRLIGYTATGLGADPLVVIRLFSLAMALVTGLGIYVLGRRIGPWVGELALVLYAVAPLSVLIGRSLLPDPLMMAGVVWAIVAAGTGRPTAPPHAAAAMTFWLIVAALAKLPALAFAPLAALGYMQAVGWRRTAGWAWLAASALLVYLVVCVWYRLAPWDPLPGLRALSQGTSNLLASTDIALSAPGLELLAMRMALALTWPGLLLAGLGWLLAQSRPGTRLWLNALWLGSLLFVLVTVGANTYWAYAALPAGCLLAGLAIVELQRHGRWSLLALALLAAGLLWIDPTLRRVGGYLAVQPAYARLREAAVGRVEAGESIFYGVYPDDVAWFAGGRGPSWDWPPEDLRASRGWENHRYLFSNRMDGEPVMEQLFELKPVVETEATHYVVFEVAAGARPGEPLDAATLLDGALAEPIDLGGVRLLALRARPALAVPGDWVRLEAVFERTVGDPPRLALELLHEPSGQALPLTPRSGGASFGRWGRPRIQLPTFTRAPQERMTYEYRLPWLMPLGAYSARLVVLDENSRPLEPAQTATVPLELEVRGDPKGRLLAPLDLAEAVWLHPMRHRMASWWGRPRENWLLQGETVCWLAPPHEPGRYLLAIDARADWLGDDPDSRWPVVEIGRPDAAENQYLEFNSPGSRRREAIIDWRGAGDVIALRIANPGINYSVRQPFALYPGHLSGGSRLIQIEQVELLPAD